MFVFIDRSDVTAVADAMAELTAAGRGWINLMPEGVERAELSATRSIPGMTFGRLSGRGAPIPKITWTAPVIRRKRTEPAQLGIEHPSGSKAVQRLAEAGHPVPPGWPVMQDHAIRGLVVAPREGVVPREVAVPESTDEPGSTGPPDHAATIIWALDAATILAGNDSQSWQAQIFDGT